MTASLGFFSYTQVDDTDFTVRAFLNGGDGSTYTINVDGTDVGTTNGRAPISLALGTGYHTVKVTDPTGGFSTYKVAAGDSEYIKENLGSFADASAIVGAVQFKVASTAEMHAILTNDQTQLGKILGPFQGFDIATVSGGTTTDKYYDRSGTFIDTVAHTVKADGSSTTTTTQADHTKTVDRYDTGGLLTEHDAYDASATLTFQAKYAGGVEQSSIAFGPNGNRDTSLFTNGVISSEKITGDNGYVDSKTFDANGVLTRDSVSNPAGPAFDVKTTSTYGIVGKPYTESHYTYNASGTVTTSDLGYADGHHVETARVAGITLSGNAGNDAFKSFGTNDTFDFRTLATGQDTITGFHAGDDAGHDVALFSPLLFGSFSNLLASSVDSDAGVVIHENGSDTLTLAGLTKAQLTAADFGFQADGSEVTPTPSALTVTGYDYQTGGLINVSGTYVSQHQYLPDLYLDGVRDTDVVTTISNPGQFEIGINEPALGSHTLQVALEGTDGTPGTLSAASILEVVRGADFVSHLPGLLSENPDAIYVDGGVIEATSSTQVAQIVRDDAPLLSKIVDNYSFHVTANGTPTGPDANGNTFETDRISYYNPDGSYSGTDTVTKENGIKITDSFKSVDGSRYDSHYDAAGSGVTIETDTFDASGVRTGQTKFDLSGRETYNFAHTDGFDVTSTYKDGMLATDKYVYTTGETLSHSYDTSTGYLTRTTDVLGTPAADGTVKIVDNFAAENLGSYTTNVETSRYTYDASGTVTTSLTHDPASSDYSGYIGTAKVAGQTLVGFNGNDTFTGFGSNDTFDFTNVDSFGADTIKNFKVGDGDGHSVLSFSSSQFASADAVIAAAHADGFNTVIYDSYHGHVTLLNVSPSDLTHADISIHA